MIWYVSPLTFLKAVFHKFYLVHSWILCPIFFYQLSWYPSGNEWIKRKLYFFNIIENKKENMSISWSDKYLLKNQKNVSLKELQSNAILPTLQVQKYTLSQVFSQEPSDHFQNSFCETLSEKLFLDIKVARKYISWNLFSLYFWS